MATCEECQRNKPSNVRPTGLLQPLEVLGQRWEKISMDFITHLPKTRAGYDQFVGHGGLPDQDDGASAYPRDGNGG